LRGPKFRIVDKPSNSVRLWLIELPDSFGAKHDDREASSTTIIQILGTLLAEVSVLKSFALMDALKERFKDGLSHKLLAGLPYPMIYRNVMSREIFDSLPRSGENRLPKDWKFKIVESADLGWVGGLAPGYSEEKALRALKNRYSCYLDPVRVTVRRLAGVPEACRTFDRLRKDGWLDWHLLGAVCSVAVNFRISGNQRTDLTLEDLLKAFNEGMKKTERETDPAIPVSEFTEEALRLNMNVIMSSTLKVSGFECRQRAPDFPAIARFLGERFKYWSDDIPHENPFARPAES
jgi:hypothetical protein